MTLKPEYIILNGFFLEPQSNSIGGTRDIFSNGAMQAKVFLRWTYDGAAAGDNISTVADINQWLWDYGQFRNAGYDKTDMGLLTDEGYDEGTLFLTWSNMRSNSSRRSIFILRKEGNRISFPALSSGFYTYGDFHGDDGEYNLFWANQNGSDIDFDFVTDYRTLSGIPFVTYKALGLSKPFSPVSSPFNIYRQFFCNIKYDICYRLIMFKIP